MNGTLNRSITFRGLPVTVCESSEMRIAGGHSQRPNESHDDGVRLRSRSAWPRGKRGKYATSTKWREHNNATVDCVWVG